MEKIWLFADSPCDLRHEDIAGKPISIVSCVVMYDGKIERDIDINRPVFWEYLKNCPEIPNTAMASPGEWQQGFEAAYANGCTHVIGLVVSTAGSSVLQTARVGMDLFLSDHPDAMTFELIDSRGYSIMYGRIVLEAAEMVQNGASFADTAAFMKQRVNHAHAVFSVYSLKCMKKSGRISGMSAFVGEALGIRPILRGMNGKIAPIDKVRGEKNLTPKLIEHIKTDIADSQDQIFYLVYGSVAPEEIDRLEKSLYEAFSPKNIIRMPVGCAVSVNAGPDVMAVIYYGTPIGE